ncbi:outer membrane protein assembly factor BamD [Dokdonia sp. Hel_I_53]|uniref:outer membrane protein assembly factor BamD n=1 Tax=Dokdonia sp. Hel_I_53 TaxID=1566287 RepID=UPI00119C662F|nr:outer membrane protein assembly factor BamD [Dokdonia sp. Hel_I_53]TVZ53266.1 Beta-barrel assembly machine subunit BamD [Dokdonia sp. Hel_I_53]
MKNLFLLFIAIIFLSSCSPYQDVLKNDDIAAKYSFADSLYKQGKYKKSLKLWEQIEPLYRGRPQAERVSFLYADSYYQIGDYYLSGYQFERFTKAFPESTKREEAAFKSAKSYYKRSPRYDLDQGDTFVATEKLQNFINAYPDSERLTDANEMAQELRDKIEYKAYKIAKGYNKIGASRGTFPNAIKAFDNFLQDYPGSKYREDALFWKFDSAYQLGLGSVQRLKEERLQAAKNAYLVLEKYFPQGKYAEEAAERLEIINRELQDS